MRGPVRKETYYYRRPMLISVFRKTLAENYTVDRWLVNAQYQCMGLELPTVAPVPGGLLAIPAGTYQVVYNQSARFSLLAGHAVYLPQLLDLPGRTTLFHGQPISGCGIRIHSGNVVNGIPAGQTGGPRVGPYNVNDPLRTDVIGCLIVGTGLGADGKTLLNSRIALAPLVSRIAAAQTAGEAITLTITETIPYV